MTPAPLQGFEQATCGTPLGFREVPFGLRPVFQGGSVDWNSPSLGAGWLWRMQAASDLVCRCLQIVGQERFRSRAIELMLSMLAR